MRRLEYGTIELVLGNIVDQDTDAIVNAANAALAGGGGVDGAIQTAAGPSLLQECLQLPADDQGRRCQTGDVKTTGGGNLKCRYVIHAVGPIYDERNAEKAHTLLRLVHANAMKAAIENECHSIAFPAISTGAYRFPIREAAEIAIHEVASFLQATRGISLARFVLFQQSQYEVFETALMAWQPP